MHKYAQINTSTGCCVCVSYLSAEVEGNHMLLLADDADVLPGDVYAGGIWTRPEPEPLPDPGPTPDQRIEQLEAENAGMALELAENQIRFNQLEQAQADLLLTLVQGGVL